MQLTPFYLIIIYIIINIASSGSDYNGPVMSVNNEEYVVSTKITLLWWLPVRVYTLRTWENGRHFPDGILECISWMKIIVLGLKFHRNMFPRIQLTISQHGIRWWLAADRVTTHFLNQWWPGGCFVKVSRALQDILSKFVYCRNRTSCENFKLKLCMCAQSHWAHVQHFSLKFST